MAALGAVLAPDVELSTPKFIPVDVPAAVPRLVSVNVGKNAPDDVPLTCNKDSGVPAAKKVPIPNFPSFLSQTLIASFDVNTTSLLAIVPKNILSANVLVVPLPHPPCPAITSADER